MSPSPGKQSPTHNVPNQGLATLLVMIAVLTIIILFCCFAAPGIRDICRKFCRCQIDNPHGGDAAARMRYNPDSFTVVTRAGSSKKKKGELVRQETQRQQ